jgi:hypothetical protein
MLLRDYYSSFVVRYYYNLEKRKYPGALVRALVSDSELQLWQRLANASGSAACVDIRVVLPPAWE